jgi:hypothetical protein
MAVTIGGFILDPNGQTLVVDVTTPGGGRPTVYTASQGSSTHTLPVTITTRTGFYITTPLTLTVSVKRNGVEIASQTGTTLTVDVQQGVVQVITPGIDRPGSEGQADVAAAVAAEVVRADAAYEPFTTIRSYAGITGVEADDQTAAILAAMTAAAAAGKELRVTPGTYTYSAEIAPPSGLRLVDAGGTFKMKTGSACNFLSTSSAVNDFLADGIRVDVNGHTADFASCIALSGGGSRATIRNSRFFDSNPPSTTETVGTGDGVTSTFTRTLTNSPTRQPLSTTFVVTDGSQTLTDDGDGVFTGNGSGTVSYGNEDVAGAISVTFTSPPANGATITVAYSHCQQRQYIVLLGFDSVKVQNNRLTEGGRIKVGRPGKRLIITGNHVRDVNDNGISMVDTSPGGVTEDVVVSSNIVKNCGTAGIYFGGDGQSATGATMVCRNFVVSDNIVTGDFTVGIKAILPVTADRIAVRGNIISKVGTSGSNTIGIQFNVVSTTVAHESGIIAGNIITGPLTFAAIDIQNMTNLSVVGNMGKDMPNASLIRLRAAIVHAVIANNVGHNVGFGVNHTAGDITDVLIDANVIDTTGAASYAYSFTGAGTILRCRLSNNIGKGAGTGLRVTNSSGTVDLDRVNNDLSNNTVAATEITSTFVATAVSRDNKGVDFLGLVRGTVAKTGNYTLTVNDYTVEFDSTSGALTAALPAAATVKGRVFVIKKVVALNTVIIDPNSTETIDGAATLTLTDNGQAAVVQSNGTEWKVLSSEDTPTRTAALVIGSVAAGPDPVGYYTSIPHSARGTNALTVSRLHLAPIRFSRTISFDKIGCELTGALANAVLRVGLYAIDATTLLPSGAALVDSSLDGSVTPAWVENTISLTVAPGLYWLVGVQQTAAATWRVINGSAYKIPYPASGAIMGASSAMAMGLRSAADNVTGALGSSPALHASAVATVFPLIGLHVSA